MEKAIAGNLTPEEEELERKKAELSVLESELSQRELDLATLQAELHAFDREYFRTVGIRYTELDRIEAQITQYLASLEAVKDFQPSQNLKKLYREIAKQLHPDLAIHDKERLQRQRLMIEVNKAYEAGDEEQMLAIFHLWQSSPESVQGDGIVAELIRTIRKISQSQRRLKEIEEEITALEKTELYLVKNQVLTARQKGRDLLGEMAVLLDQQILTAKERLDNLKTKLGMKI